MDWISCRICLESGDMVSLFDCDENKEQLSDKYSYCCGITVTSSDSLPTMICAMCVEKLTFAYQFKQQCLTSNKILKECLLEVNNERLVAPPAMEPDARNSTAKETETITIQKKGTRRQYKVPIEHNPSEHHSKIHLTKTQVVKVCTKVPRPKMRGLPLYILNEQGLRASPNSPCTKKGEMEQSRTQLLKNNDIGISFNDDDQPENEPLDETETITIQKKGTRRQLPIEHNPSGHHSKTHLAKTQVVKVCNMRGLPLYILNEQGLRASPNSPGIREEEMEQSQTQLLKNNDIGISFNDDDQPEADPLNETETITIQKKGTRRQYKVPIEHNPSGHHSKTHLAKTQVVKVCTKVPRPKMRGLPSYNLNKQGLRASLNSPCTRKEEMEQSRTQLLKNNDIGISFNDDDQPEADPLDDLSPDIRMKERAINTEEQNQTQLIDDGIGIDDDPNAEPLDVSGYCKKKKPTTKGNTCQICKLRTARTNNTKRYFLAKFPKNEERCKKWVQITGNLDLVYVPIEKLHQLKYLCGKHFRDKDFNKKKTNLRKNAIPSKALSAEPLSDEIMKDFPLHIYKEKTFTHDHIYASAKFDVDEM